MNEKLRIYLLLFFSHPWMCDAVTDESSRRSQPRAARYPSLDCTFEEGICSWRHASLDSELRWGMSQKGPDHTTGDGFYLRLRNDGRAHRLVGSFLSPPVDAFGPTCLSFWYFMKDQDVGELTVRRIGVEEPVELFRMFGGQGNRWYHALVPAGSGFFQLMITGSVANRSPLGGIGLDDISFSYEKCPDDELKNAADQPHIACDFEDDLCSWYSNEYSMRALWVHSTVQPDTSDRNPVPPLSSDKGMVKVVRERQAGYNSETQLQGPTISVGSDQACFSFWYKLEGEMVWPFEVRLKHHIESDPPVNVFTSEEPKRPTWIQANITLPEKDNFFIIFAAMTRRDRKGTLLIDGINIRHGRPCSQENQEDLINCNFDHDLCRWYLATKKGEKDWARLEGPTPTHSTGPPHDHTTGDGYYVFLDASKVDSAYLYSQDIYVDYTGACLSFWYYMYGEDVYKLELHVQADPYNVKQIWHLEGPQENEWIQQNISLSPVDNKRARLMFIAQSAYFPRGDIALDDISITFGAPCESDIPEPLEPEELTSRAASATTTSAAKPEPTSVPKRIVLPTPNLIIKEGSTTVYENSQVVLECQTGINTTVMTTWFQVTGNGTGDVYIINENVDYVLVIDEMKLEDGGTFACATSYSRDVTSELSNRVTIKVVPDPRRKADLYANVYVAADHPVEVDTIVKLTCGAFEVNGAEYLWRTTSLAFKYGRIPLPNSRELILNGTTVDHSGVYSCRISKDGFLTGKSKELDIKVVPGKPCDYNWQCNGEEYKSKCSRKRCRCNRNAVPIGPRCIFKPERPKIMTFPRFLEYGLGESFYVTCRAKNPAPPTMGYTFITPKGRFEAYDTIKISHATREDTGYYTCFVSHRDVTSEHSNQVTVQIKDFTDLSCNFRKGLCNWSHREGSRLVSFQHVSGNAVIADSKHRAFIQGPKSDSDIPNKAVLISSTIDRTTLDSCLKFEYRMLGSDVRALSVWVYKFAEKLYDDGGTRLWTAIGEKGKKWIEKNVTIPSGEDFHISFEAIGTVAIADIKFTYRGGC